MARLKLFEQMQLEDAKRIPFLNTGTPLDMGTASDFLPGMNGEAILSGGLAPTNGASAREHMFKSTLMNGCMVMALARYKDAEGVIYDSENSQIKERLITLHDFHLDDQEKRSAVSADIADRLRLVDRTMGDLEWFFEQVKALCALKEKHQKDYMVETPFYDHATGSNFRMYLPTIIGIDSLSKAGSQAIYDILDKKSASDSDTNTVFMKDGLIKTKIMNQLQPMCHKYGIYLCVTAHLGDKFNLDPYAPKTKDLWAMRGNDTMKGTGSSFPFLVSTLLELRGVKPLIDSNKESEYPLPSGSTNPMEFQLVNAVTTRCKNAPTNVQFPFVVSQSAGIQPSLSHYDYLRDHGYFGLLGSKQHHKTAFQPDVSLSRSTITSKIRDYKTRRALELLYQICFIQNDWSIGAALPGSNGIDMVGVLKQKIDLEKLPELLSSRSYAMDDILNSRGYWTYDKTDPRPYLSAYDVMNIIAGNYKPKLNPVGNLSTSEKIAKIKAAA